ncbi:MAG TPA: pyridoxal phosphate-dependent aminotransferase [Bacteroidota bacterium]|nr:pyridoxal phosphate-dependent aminotransferase [Bacteroidota bacterium]
MDLTNSNPTDCGFEYPATKVLAALTAPENLHYVPDPHGNRSARESVVGYYASKGLNLNPDDVFLTASTSESYSLIFKLLCDPGDNILVPSPAYPLFDYLAQINDVATRSYHLIYDDAWHINIGSIERTLTDSTRAIVLVNPHNPTGMFLRTDVVDALADLAKSRNIALLVDEVFIDYAFQSDLSRIPTTAGLSGALTFTLNGISKMVGFPQMKLGWVVVSGPQEDAAEAKERLEILCDTFLTVGTPVQLSLPRLLTAGSTVHGQILRRITSNYNTLCKSVNRGSACSVLAAEGGWCAVIRAPETRSDEQWALELLDSCGVYLYPGYFFDFDKESHLVVSLLPRESEFLHGVCNIIEYIDRQSMQTRSP